MKKLFLLSLTSIFFLTCLKAQDCSNVGSNLVVNGDFSNGNMGFTSVYDNDPQGVCSRGAYGVVHEPREKCDNSAWLDDLWDHTQADDHGLYMVIDGADTGVSDMFWMQSVPVVQGVTYNFSFFLRPSVTDDDNEDLRLSVFVDGVSISNTIDPSEGNDWEQHCYQWTANTSGNVPIAISQVLNFNHIGFDYGVDDIFFGSVCDVTATFDIRYSLDTCQITVSSTSTSSNMSNILGYHWDFGDGHTSTEEVASHDYAGSGIYDVCLTVMGANNGDCCTQTTCQKVEVNCGTDSCTNSITDIGVWSTQLGSCEYTLSASFDVNKPILGYFWDFGDGTTSTSAPNVSHVFPNGNNTYMVCLTIYSLDGTECCTDTYCEEIRVSCGPSFPKGRDATGSSTDIKDFIKIHPNPASSDFALQFSSVIGNDYSVYIYNSQGQQVISRNGLGKETQTTVRLQDEQLTPGVYYLSLITNGKALSQKLIIKH